MGHVLYAGRNPQGHRRSLEVSLSGAEIPPDKQLDILHDHYKETFARVVLMERSRDRLFLLVIVLFALLSLEIGYPASFEGSVGSLSFAGTVIDLDALPLAALLNATWVLALAVVLDYCRKSIWVSRSYRYVHELEKTISPQLDAGDMYQREGHWYANNYPMLLNASWIAYVFVFPVILFVATIGLLSWELKRLDYPWFHKAFDVAISFVLLAVFVLYQVQPYIAQKIRDRRERRKDRTLKHRKRSTADSFPSVLASRQDRADDR